MNMFIHKVNAITCKSIFIYIFKYLDMGTLGYITQSVSLTYKYIYIYNFYIYWHPWSKTGFPITDSFPSLTWQSKDRAVVTLGGGKRWFISSRTTWVKFDATLLPLWMDRQNHEGSLIACGLNHILHCAHANPSSKTIELDRCMVIYNRKFNLASVSPHFLKYCSA